MAGTTPIAGIRYPELEDSPNAESGFQNMATDIDSLVIPRYATTGARDAAIPAPVQGQYCDITGGGLQRYSGSAWASAIQTTRIVRKASSESVTSSTTFQDDNELFASVEANSVYEFIFRLTVYGSTSGDIKTRPTFPASATADVWSSGPSTTTSAVGATTVSLIGATPSSSPGYEGDFGVDGVNSVSVLLEGVLTTGASAGTLTLQWAQLASFATATQVLAGSHLRITKIS